jgi:hypothetical protein
MHWLQPESDGDDRRVWRFKCDTLDEMNQWVDAFATSLKVK